MTGARGCRSVVCLCLFVFSLTAKVRFGIAEPLSREPRQVIYADSNFASLDNDNDDDEVTREVPVGGEQLLPSIPYPGDLSGFFRTEPQTTTISLKLSQDGGTRRRRRRKRGAYLRDEDDQRYPMRRGRLSQPSDFSEVESRLAEVYQADETNLQEMSFNGAGYLRTVGHGNDDLQRVSQSFNPPPENRRAAHDFQAAFHPGRSRGAVRDDSTGTHSAPKPKPTYIEALDPAIHGFAPVPPAPKREAQAQPEQTSEVFNAFAQHYQSVPELNDFFYKQQQPRTAPTEEPKTEPTTDDKKGSSPTNHRMDRSASREIRVAVTKSGKMISGPSKKEQPDTKKQKATRRRRRSASSDGNSHHDQGSHDDDTAASASTHSGETRDSTRYSIPEDHHQDAGSGFIPLTGTFNGGTIHFSLPTYYGSAGPVSPPSYSSGPPVGYSSYASPRHYGGGGGGGPEYYPHSEARRYSYGMLGSGNFEVIRGGLYPEKKHQHQVLGGFDGGRSHYAPAEVFNGFGGATEIIIDGPIQGFQGFDNFPAHLINALSKRSEVIVGKPPVL